MNLYKYTTIEVAIEILSNQKLRFTQPLAFNDPFDANPFIAKLYSKEEQKILMEEIFSNNDVVNDLVLNSFYETLKTDYSNTKLSFDEDQLLKMFHSIIKNKYGTITNFVLSNTNEEKMLEKTINNFITYVLTLTGIFSLTKDPKNLLMWAHYADCNRGVVFEFEGTHPFFQQSNNDIYFKEIEIKYSENRPMLELNIKDFSNSDKLLKLFSEIYFTKSTEWEYEAEYRVVRKLEENTFAGFQDKDGFDVHLFSFPKEIIKGIIFGNKILLHNVDKIKNLISEKKYDNVRFNQIKLDRTRYLLHIDEM